MSAPDIPTHYTIATSVNGALDLDLDNIHIREIAPITLNSTSKLSTDSELDGKLDVGLDKIGLKSDSKLTSDSKLKADATVDLGLDDIRINNLPPLELNVQASVKPTRVHFPINLKFAVCVLGKELVSFRTCGETMVVIEDYVPHKTEECR
jgi:hypothetical protein